jgi:hypothetical protein
MKKRFVIEFQFCIQGSFDATPTFFLYLNMQKTYFFVLLIAMHVINIATAQTYYAAHVQGDIYIQKNNTSLKLGDVIDANDLLKINNNSWAILVGEEGNLFLKAPSPKDSISICSKAIQQIAIEKKTNSINFSLVDNLQAYFEGDQFVFIGNEFQLTLNPDFYPLSPQLFLIYRYEYNERHITIEIPYSKQTIFLNPKILYTYKGEKILPHKTTNTSMYVFNAIDNMPYAAANLNPIWLSNQFVQSELQVLKKAYTAFGKKTTQQMKQGYMQYISDVYGKTDENYLSNWIDNYLE